MALLPAPRRSKISSFLVSFSTPPLRWSAAHLIWCSTGIGKFTILDPAPVEGSDVGNNFFLEPSSIGKLRAEEVTRYLLELNNDVTGAAVVQVSLAPYSRVCVEELELHLKNRTSAPSSRPPLILSPRIPSSLLSTSTPTICSPSPTWRGSIRSRSSRCEAVVSTGLCAFKSTSLRVRLFIASGTGAADFSASRTSRGDSSREPD
jgi:hypothetical protein